MEFIHWATDHGFDLLEGIGIIASLAFTAAAFRRDDRSRRVANLFALTAEHREIWTHLYRQPELNRVLESHPSLDEDPVTNAEALIVTFLLLHLSATYRALRAGMFATGEAICRDINWFLGLPIPREVWKRSKDFLEPDFVRYVDACIDGGSPSAR